MNSFQHGLSRAQLTQRLVIALVACVASVSGTCRSYSAEATPEQIEFFERKIRPLLAGRCIECHGPDAQEAGLRLDSQAGLLAGSAEGQVVVAGQPDQSRLWEVIGYRGRIQMPPDGKLADEELALLRQWIEQGLPWPGEQAPQQVAASAASVARWSDAYYEQSRQQHWAFQPLSKPAPPENQNESWARNDIDRFVMAKLETAGLAPSAAADTRTWLRRVTYDLIGLPPTPAEYAAFTADPSPEAKSRVVDALLARPEYGQRWARHWLDVARYADTKGYVFTADPAYPFSYTYRDWLVRALNEDLPYDRFIEFQLAADLSPHSNKPQDLAALGYLTVGSRFMNNPQDQLDDRIDVVSRGFLGMTVSCARCHDHKFDPIPTADYYSLYGVFASSPEPDPLPILGPPEVAAAFTSHQEQIKALEKQLVDMPAGANEEAAKPLREQIEKLKQSAPPEPPRAMVVADAATPHEARIFLRGNAGRPGDVVPRQFLRVLAGTERTPFAQGSGRLELAQSIAMQPISARVIVNRLWAWHFDQPLVATPSDFGMRTAPASHPELLEYLAASFQEQGGSLKQLHRQIVLSSTYAQQSIDRPEARQIDPENRLLWRMNRHRLEFEELRDSLLAVAGKLDCRLDGKGERLLRKPFSTRRTLYGWVDRNDLPGWYRSFDFPTPEASAPERPRTTVPQQALFLLNSEFVHEQARHLSHRTALALLQGQGRRVEMIYQLALGRAPTHQERQLALGFVQNAVPAEPVGDEKPLDAWEQLSQVLLASNEFMFVD
jgi:mono/diheme cytochrome c family protein